MTPVGRDDSARRASQDFALRSEFLSQRWERNQRIARGGLRWASPPIVAPPPAPRLRGIPLYPSARFPARKIRFRVSFIPGHWALMRRKISVSTVSQPRLVPTSRGRGTESGVRRSVHNGRLRRPNVDYPVTAPRNHAAVGPKSRWAGMLDRKGAPDGSRSNFCWDESAGGSGEPPLQGNFSHGRYDGRRSHETDSVSPHSMKGS